MNLLSFLLILSVNLVLREELLTYALIMWGLLLLGRFIWSLRPSANYQKVKSGRNYY